MASRRNYGDYNSGNESLYRLLLFLIPKSKVDLGRPAGTLLFILLGLQNLYLLSSY